MRIFLFMIMLASPAVARAEHTVTEILFIPWGEGPNELEIREPYREYSDDTRVFGRCWTSSASS